MNHVHSTLLLGHQIWTMRRKAYVYLSPSQHSPPLPCLWSLWWSSHPKDPTIAAESISLESTDWFITSTSAEVTPWWRTLIWEMLSLWFIPNTCLRLPRCCLWIYSRVPLIDYHPAKPLAMTMTQWVWQFLFPSKTFSKGIDRQWGPFWSDFTGHSIKVLLSIPRPEKKE